MIPQYLFYHRPPDQFKSRFFQQIQRSGQLHLQRGLAVHQANRAIQQAANVIHAAPYLRHATVHTQQAVDRLHGGTHRILGGKHGIPGRLGKLTQKGEVDTAVGNYVGPVSRSPGHEEGGDIGHHGGHTHRAILGQLRNQFRRHTDVVEPLLGDLLAGTVLHRLFDKIP